MKKLIKIIAMNSEIPVYKQVEGAHAKMLKNIEIILLLCPISLHFALLLEQMTYI